MFEKILIANRGEIAVRIIRTCKRMGVGTVAVYSEVDSRSLHVKVADEAVLLGGSRSEESYLAKEKIIDVALKHNCQAIHPGYGFLSENSEFAEMVFQAELVFIGPPASAIATLGDKIASKALAASAGLPVVPGSTQPLSNLKDALAVARQYGYPVLLKPTAGGGGKGMRIVTKKKEMDSAFKACQGEARKAFGDDNIFLERYIDSPRHVEIQIVADHYGNIIHLGERECSIQRRYQKIIEEAPSIAIDDSLRQTMGEMACKLARKAGYTNVGTVEFVLDTEGSFYFLEMNTRLQVEHPVTEMVTSIDLVGLQLRISSGEPLPIRQKEVSVKGWAIEARICAEDASRGFLPSTGMITRYAVPRGRCVRVDSGLEAGSLISPYYDSMLAKVVAWGKTRQDAIKRLSHALNGYHIEGLATNIDFANAILNHPAFIRGELSTDFIGEHFEDGQAKIAPPTEHLHYMALVVTLFYHNRQSLVRNSLKPMTAYIGGTPHQKASHQYMAKEGDTVFELWLHRDEAPHAWVVMVNKNRYQVVTPEFEFYRRRLELKINGELHQFRLQYRENFIWVAFCGITRTFEVYSPLEWRLVRYVPEPKKKILDSVLRCPMPGLIVDIMVKKGEQVHRGQELVIIESMKMESGVASPCDGEVQDVIVQQGQAVETDDTLITFKT